MTLVVVQNRLKFCFHVFIAFCGKTLGAESLEVDR